MAINQSIVTFTLKKFLSIFVLLYIFISQNICYSQENFEPVYIHRTKEELEEIKMKNMLLMRAPAPLKAQPRGQKSLLEFMPYIGEDRNQGSCGNCWVWAATASLEIQNAAFRNIKDRLSIQYFDSNYGYPDYSDFVCTGGYPFDFVRFYSQEKKLIPWSNKNADYKDKNGPKSCRRENGTSYECPNVEPNKIAETPNYNMESLGLYNIVQSSDSDEEITDKIKYYINNNVPLTLDFCFSDLNDFNDFWDLGNEETIFDLTNIPSNQVNEYFLGCHSTIIIGYNDKSNNNDEHYFEVLNSWGTTENRPHGTFRIKMNSNYRKAFCISDGACYDVIEGIYVMNPHFQNADENVGNVIIKVIDSNENYISKERIIFNDQEYFTDKNGVIIVPNVKNGTQYNISLYANDDGYEYNEELDDLKCYEYEKKEFQGILDFSDNNEVIFTFKRNYIDNQNENAKFPIQLYFRDEDGNEIDDVTINFNGQIFHSGSGESEFEIPNVPNHFDYEISVYKDNYIFDITSIKGKTNYYCELDGMANVQFSNYKTFKFIGHEVTGNNVTVKVVDVNNNVIPDETVIFNGQKYLTDSNGEINFENVKSGKDYDVKIFPYHGGPVLIDGESVCYNYDSNNRKRGTFDFTDNKHQILTFVRHYNDYSHSSDFPIMFNDEKRGISDVIVDFNGKIFLSDMYGYVYIDNLPYGTTYKIKYSKEGYLSGEQEGKFIDDLSEYEKSDCISRGIGIILKKDENYIPPTNTPYDACDFKMLKGDITIWFDDGNDNTLTDVTIDFNGKIYNSGNSANYIITNVKNNLDYTLNFYKDGYEFEPITGTTNWDCEHTDINLDPVWHKVIAPIATSTSTSTNTQTFTNTNTCTLTNSLTNTLTNTRTNTLTSTPTKISFTKTFTPTRTKKPSSTATKANTHTKTFTVTNTNTNTNTNTFTSTNSLTNTLTNTQTNTLTSTPTKISFTKTFTPTRTKKPSFTATKANTHTKTFTVTNTNTNTNTSTNTNTNTNTNSNTSTNTNTFTSTNTYTLVPADTSTFTYTPTKLIVIPTSTFTSSLTIPVTQTPILPTPIIETPIVETPIVYTPISTPIETGIVEPMGKIAVKVVDILGSGVGDVSVIFNKDTTYVTDIYGYVYIDNVKLDEKFSLVWFRDGYLFDPNFYDGILTSSNNELKLEVTIYADNAYTNCKEVRIDLTKLKKNVSKIYKFSQISQDADKEIINKKFLKIRKIISKIPLTAMICKDSSNFNTLSFKRKKAQLQKSIKILYREIVYLNRNYAKENNVSKRLLKKRLLKLKRYYNISKSEVFSIPMDIHYIKEQAIY